MLAVYSFNGSSDMSKHPQGGRRTLETSLISDIVDQQNTHSTSIVCSGDRSEALLSSSIPNL